MEQVNVNTIKTINEMDSAKKPHRIYVYCELVNRTVTTVKTQFESSLEMYREEPVILPPVKGS